MSNTQRKKNIRLLLTLVLLLLVTVSTYYLGGTEDKVDIDKDLFLIEDVSQIDEVKIRYANGRELHLKYDAGRWVVNGDFVADRGRVDVFFAVINQVKVRRPVSKAQRSEVAQDLKQKGVVVSLFVGGERIHEFRAGGNAAKTLAYFQATAPEDNVPYLVNIPGYQSYVSGIFEMEEREWKDRVVFGRVNWANLEKVQVKYPGREDESFDVIYDDRNYVVSQMPKADTALLYDFLDNISYLRVYQYIDLEGSGYEDLVSSGENASISVQDLDQQQVKLRIFPRTADPKYVLGSIDSLTWALFDFKPIKAILVRRSSFQKAKETAP